MRVQLEIFEGEELVFDQPVELPVELGRQQPREPSPYQFAAAGDVRRLIIASSRENVVSRRHVLLEPSPHDELTVRVTNLSETRPIDTDQETRIECGESANVAVPIALGVGDRVVAVEPIQPPTPEGPLEDEQDNLHIQSLAHQTLAPGQSFVGNRSIAEMVDAGQAQLDMECLQALVHVFESVAGSPDFVQQAARAACQELQLDFSAVLLWKDRQWQIEASETPDNSAPWRGPPPSRTLLGRMARERRTLIHSPRSGDAEVPLSQVGLASMVAAPILAPSGEVIGALYGSRQEHERDISELEASVVELLACGVAAGLARQTQEQAALAARVQFEQFFTPQLARQLEANPDLLKGREAEVTVLFCDIRGFSAVSHRVGPQLTVEWVGDLMGRLSDCVANQEGVLVDYIGDELVAMWGAPEANPRHAELACRAAIEMMEAVAEASIAWKERIGTDTRVGIGINSGPAHVGNTGSYRKFKYGPLGNTVNLASRIQGATKHVKSSLIISDSTLAGLNDNFVTRRLCQVQVVNIQEAVTLFELVSKATVQWPEICTKYEKALGDFENRRFRRAAQVLGNLLVEYPQDGPTLRLLARTVNAMANGPDPTHPVWVLDSK